jgi:hypothetical protein
MGLKIGFSLTLHLAIMRGKAITSQRSGFPLRRHDAEFMIWVYGTIQGFSVSSLALKSNSMQGTKVIGILGIEKSFPKTLKHHKGKDLKECIPLKSTLRIVTEARSARKAVTPRLGDVTQKERASDLKIHCST